MNWGIRIALLYTGFVIMILCMVIQTMHYKVDLVSADYYDQELKFQEKINATRNVDSLHVRFDVNINPESVVLIYPEQWQGKKVEGHILFYRPSDSALDITIPATPDTKGIQEFNSRKFRRGRYKMVCDFSVEGQKFAYEKYIFING